MIKLLRTFFSILILLLVFVACEHRKLDDGDIVLAEVGDEILLLNDLKKDIAPDHFAGDSLQVIRQYRDNWINRQLKVKEAERLGLDEHEEVKRRIRQARGTILADAFNEAVYLEESPEPVSRTEAQTYYESNKEKFVLAERHVRFRHLIAGSFSDAQNARNAIQRGQSWRDVAESYGINPQQALRHSQKYWPISSAANQYEELNTFLERIGVSEISPIRRIGDHYHFVQLMESRDAGDHPQIEWIIDQISEWLLLERRRKKLRSIEQNLFLQAQANNELRIFDIRQPEQEVEIVTDTL